MKNILRILFRLFHKNQRLFHYRMPPLCFIRILVKSTNIFINSGESVFLILFHIPPCRKGENPAGDAAGLHLTHRRCWGLRSIAKATASAARSSIQRQNIQYTITLYKQLWFFPLVAFPRKQTTMFVLYQTFLKKKKKTTLLLVFPFLCMRAKQRRKPVH